MRLRATSEIRAEPVEDSGSCQGATMHKIKATVKSGSKAIYKG